MHKNEYIKGIYYILLMFAIVALGVFFKLSVSFTLPVTVAILISCVFYPIVKRMNQKIKIPWVLGTIITAFIFVIIISLLLTIIGTSLTTIVGQYSQYEDRFLSIYKIFAETFNIQFNEELSLFENLWNQLKVREFVQSAAISFSGNLISVTKSLFIVLLLSIFLLIEMKSGHEKVDTMFKGKVQGRVITIVKKTIAEVVRYLSIKFFISLATGILVYFATK
ncbi:MAG: AI-2E family transporter, partial [Treponema sp.]|nr:AI-2E family transporter [Treponema sp.]